MRLPCALILIALTGCASRATVSGEVTVNDKPLKNGVIVFTPAEGSGAPVTGTITDGKYSLETTPGKKFVQISAPVVVGKRKEYDAPDAPFVEITEEWLPDNYHSRTELKMEVTNGANTKNWALKARPR